jgi:PleD family two-component response regulator
MGDYIQQTTTPFAMHVNSQHALPSGSRSGKGGVSLRILVAEQDVSTGRCLVNALQRQGFNAESVTSGADALTEHHRADLVLLDLELPDLDWFDAREQ